MEHSRPNLDLIDVGTAICNFIVKHLLGLASIMFGVVAKVYIVRKDWKRVSKWQCRFSVFMSGLAGSVTYLALCDTNMDTRYKAIIVGFMPIIVEPVMMRILMWVDPIIDSIGKALKGFITRKSK